MQKRVLEKIAEGDGLCRELDFEGSSWEGVSALLKWFGDNYKILSAQRSDGFDAREQIKTDTVSMCDWLWGNKGGLHITGDSEHALFSHLQLFVSSGVNRSAFVEVTFFPDDVRSSEKEADKFQEFFQYLAQILRAKTLRFRREDVCWEFGEISRR